MIRLQATVEKRPIYPGRKSCWIARYGTVEVQALTKKEALEKLHADVDWLLSEPPYHYVSTDGPTRVWSLYPSRERGYEFRTPGGGLVMLAGEHGREWAIRQMIAHAREYAAGLTGRLRW